MESEAVPHTRINVAAKFLPLVSQSTKPGHLHPTNKIGKLTGQKLLKTQRDVPIAIIIIPLKNIRHPLQNNTTLHKQIETHPPLPALIISRIQQVHESSGEMVAECYQGVGVFVEGNGAGFVFVEAVEEGAPGGEKGPKTAGCGGCVSTSRIYG